MEFSGNSLSDISLAELSRNLQYSSQLLENNVTEEAIKGGEQQIWRKASKNRCSADSNLSNNKSVDISVFRKTNNNNTINGTITGEGEIIVKNICEDWVDLTESSKKKKGLFQKSKSLKNLVSAKFQQSIDNFSYFDGRKF